VKYIYYYLQVGADSLVDITGGLSPDLEELRDEIISTLTPTPGDNEDDDDGLSGGIIALIVILVVLTVIVLVVVVVGLLVYRSKHSSKFVINVDSVKKRGYGGTDYLTDTTAVSNTYVTTQELQASSNVQEMVSSEPEPYHEDEDKKDGDESGDTIVKQNAGFSDDDVDTHL